MDNIGIQIGEILAQVVVLFAAVKWLAGRITRIEDTIDRKLNNGIKDELTEVKISIATITERFEALPRRKSDEEG